MNMRKLSLLLIGLLCFNVAMPSGAAAQQKQQKDEPEDFMKDVLSQIFGPNWNVYLQGGVSTGSRFLLQRPILPAGVLPGEQSVETKTGWNIGIGGGGDYLLRQGFRFSYLYGKNDIKFRTNNGDGSSNLDVETNAKLHSNTLGIELIRYLLPSRATITPYGTLGVLGNWYGLDTSPLVQAPGGTSQFSLGATIAFGLQVREWEHLGVRLEASSLTLGNPFTGKNSFRTVGAVPFDEPSSIGRWDYRLVGTYYFQKRGTSLLKKIEKKVEEQP
jgi:hypothetical protein